MKSLCDFNMYAPASVWSAPAGKGRVKSLGGACRHYGMTRMNPLGEKKQKKEVLIIDKRGEVSSTEILDRWPI